MRILFAGNAEIAVPSLEALADMQDAGTGAVIAGVLTNPDSFRGRNGKKEPTAVSAAATAISRNREALGRPGIPQFKPETLGPEAREAVGAVKPDLLVCFAYGRIFGPKFLSLFPLGGINIHPSLLPRYRGATPIPAAILNRDRETGITIQQIAAEPDTGDILVQARFPIADRETAATLNERGAQKARELAPEVIAGIMRNGVIGQPQQGEATYCTLISKADGRICWSAGAEAIDAQVRAYTPWPLAWTLNGALCLYILEAAPYPDRTSHERPGTVAGTDKRAGILVQTGDGLLGITRLQYQTKKPLDWRAFLNGARDFLTAVLT